MDWVELVVEDLSLGWVLVLVLLIVFVVLVLYWGQGDSFIHARALYSSTAQP